MKPTDALGLRERLAFERATVGLVDDLLARLALSGPFSLNDFCRKLTAELGTELQTYHTRMPSEIGGLGLAGRDGRLVILVNRRRILLAEDYTILHELGHLVLGHLDSGRDLDERDEFRADLFAREVLGRMIRRVRRPTVFARLKRFFQL